MRLSRRRLVCGENDEQRERAIFPSRSRASEITLILNLESPNGNRALLLPLSSRDRFNKTRFLIKQN